MYFKWEQISINVKSQFDQNCEAIARIGPNGLQK